MNDPRLGKSPSRVLGILCALLLVLFPAGALLTAQAPPPQSQPAQPLSPEQLDTLVAPIALYPDSLLSQVLVAATYPLEVVEANQWLQQNRNLQGSALVNAAQQQNWDPSVQALVVFPDVLRLLTSDIRWSTDLGNAFLAQQADVMNAVQRMRAQAQAAGRLNSNPQETVTNQTQDGRSVIEIAPANPQVVYVPEYDPAYIWGPPAWGYYPPLYYPAHGFGYYPGIYIGGFFGGLGWGGWGWGPNWFSCSIIQNGFFFNRFGFNRFGYGGFRGGVWAHDPGHRLGVAYPNAGVASRFGGGRFAGGQPGFGAPRGAYSSFGNRGSSPVAGSRADPGGWRRFGEPATPGGRGVIGGTANRYAAPPVNRAGGSWSRFGNPGAQPAYRSSPAFSGAARSYSPGFGASRSVPSYRPSPAYGGGYRAAPSSGGGGFRSGGGGFRSAPSFGGGGGGFRGSGGGGFHGGGGGGGGFHGGGGGSHGGGGGHRR